MVHHRWSDSRSDDDDDDDDDDTHDAYGGADASCGGQDVASMDMKEVEDATWQSGGWG